MQEIIESLRSQIKIQVKRLKTRTPAILVLMTQSKNFGNFMKLILTLIPKQHFILMTCSPSMQICKISRCLEEIVLKGKTQLNVIKISRLTKISRICLTLGSLLNSISSFICRVGLCRSPRSKSKVNRQSWRTPYPILCNGKFILVNTNYLNVHPPWIQIW
jgi:hypothetical protein